MIADLMNIKFSNGTMILSNRTVNSITYDCYATNTKKGNDYTNTLC